MPTASKPSASRATTPDALVQYLLTHFGPLWSAVESVPVLRHLANRTLIDAAIYKTQTRPYAFSTMSPYTSWASLTDRTYSSRHLPAAEPKSGLPEPSEVAKLFLRDGEPALCPKSTLLFAYFAQWFTDGFLRTDLTDAAKNTSNHEIDLAPLYGLDKATTDVIRAHEGGRLSSQIVNGEEYPPYLYDGKGAPKARFARLDANMRPFFPTAGLPVAQLVQLFATGGDRANVQIGYLMFKVLFLREHNRIAGELHREYPRWDDERLFQTARNIVLVLLIRIVIEEYINHIAPYRFKFFLDPRAFPNERWYRQNWMAVEFTLVYRWHMLIPDKLRLDGADVDIPSTMWNSDLLTSRGLGALFDDASRQPAGRIGLFNSPPLINNVETRSIAMCRTLQLAGYNDYFEFYGNPRLRDFGDISSDPKISGKLAELYRHVDDVDFYAGIFADDPVPNAVVPEIFGNLVGIDAFSQALTNPLLNEHIFNERTFSPLGWQMISAPCRIADVLQRNTPKSVTPHLATLTRTDWKRV